MNLREEYYQYDPTLEIFSLPFYEDKLIFFEVNEGVYLLVDRYDSLIPKVHLGRRSSCDREIECKSSD